MRFLIGRKALLAGDLALDNVDGIRTTLPRQRGLIPGTKCCSVLLPSTLCCLVFVSVILLLLLAYALLLDRIVVFAALRYTFFVCWADTPHDCTSPMQAAP